MEDPENLGSGMAGAGDNLVKQYPPATHQFLEVPFNKCKACHTVEEGGKKKVGPNLFGFLGRAAGAVEGFKYSKAMLESGIVWDEEALDRYLKKPKDMVPRTKMAFPGLRKDQDRADVIAYLREATQ